MKGYSESMATLIERRDGTRTKHATAVRLWLAAAVVLIAHFALGEMGVSFVQRLVLLFAVVVLAIAGVEAFLERRET
jgi:hypothetical protein